METNPDTNFPIIKNGTIILKVKNEYQVIQIEKIVYCEADGSYSKIIFVDGSESFIAKSLLVLERKIKNINFIRCHHSYLVNITKIEKFSRRLRILTVSGSKIPMSRRKCSNVLMKLKASNDQL